MVQIRNTETYSQSAPNAGYGRGRNRWFTIADVAVGVYADGSFEIAIRSKRYGKMPPILFRLPAECRRELIQALKGER